MEEKKKAFYRKLGEVLRIVASMVVALVTTITANACAMA